MQVVSAEVRGVRPPRRRASIVKALLTSTALVNAGVASLVLAGTLSLVAVIASTSVARADGGNGGGRGAIANGSAGGVGNSGAPGSNGTLDAPSDTIGGGGGGAGGGGQGGAGDLVFGGTGGAGGTLASPNGAAGGAGGGGGGGGFNGAGGNGGVGGVGTSFPAFGLLFPAEGEGGGGGGGGGSGLGTGGAGGAGGAGGSAVDSESGASPGAVTATAFGGNGGGGGDGGIGNVQAGSVTISTVSNGGNGGAGGAGGAATASATNTVGNSQANPTGGNGGNGGNGGTGISVSGSNAIIVNSAAATGGAGGAGGVGGDVNGTATGGTAIANASGGNGGNGGAGGDGFDVTGSNVAVTNTSTVTGGAGGNGAHAGGANTVNAGTVVSGAGGNGGAGGAGAAFTGAGVSFVSSGTITAGDGGGGGQENSTAGGTVSPPLVIGGFGGAGGTGVSFGGANSTFSTTGTVTGGAGGIGGAADLAGFGGAGGAGVFFAASGAALSNAGQITGGVGGQGGNSGGLPGSSASSGGAGGTGVVFAASGATLINSGQITGGAGGAASLFGNNRAPGAGGAGVVGAGLTINNSGGTITGGLDGGGLVRQFAVEFTGGSNFISPGGTITGGIQLQAGSLMPALPGSTVGPTLTVNGPVSFAAGTNYVIRVNGAANDSINAAGIATISGANVSATINGGAASAIGKHTIVTANSITGTFAGISASNSSAFLQESLSYDLTHAYLNIVGNAANGTGIDFTTVAQTTNQRNVASALNSGGNANGFSGALINLIAGLSASQARAAFTALDGEAATGAERAAFRFMDQFLTLMIDPFANGQFGNGAGAATGFADEQQAALPPDIATAYAAVFTKAPPNFEQRWSIWNAAFGGSGKTNGDPTVVGSSDTRLSTYGYAGGIDYRFTPDLVVGVAAAGGGTNWSLANSLGNGRSDAAQVGAYSRLRIGAGYIAETIAFANHWFTTDRTALGDNLHANFTGQSLGGRIEGGYRFAAAPNFGITPYAAAQAQAFRTGAYGETDISGGGFGLNYAVKQASDVRTELGARLDNPTLLGGTPLIIRAKFAWAHDFVDTPSLGAAFQALPLSNFTVFGAPIPHDSGLASIGVDWYLSRDWKLLAKFDGEFAKGSQIYAGTAALRYSW